jgi:hypothetical protein
MWDGGYTKRRCEYVSDLRLRGMNRYLQKNRERNDYEALLEVFDLIPEFLIVRYDGTMIPREIIRG